MTSITDAAPPLKSAAGRYRELPSILERARTFLLGPLAAVLESRDEVFSRALEHAFAEFAREMSGS